MHQVENNRAGDSKMTRGDDVGHNGSCCGGEAAEKQGCRTEKNISAGELCLFQHSSFLLMHELKKQKRPTE